MKFKILFLIIGTVLSIQNSMAQIKVIDVLQSKAAQGDAASQYSLGLEYFYGSHIPQDTRKGIELLSKAGGNGFSMAFYTLGNIYQKGSEGENKDIQKAIDFYQKGAKVNDSNSQIALGNIYKYGTDGITKDIIKAKAIYKDACLRGNMTGCSYYKDINQEQLHQQKIK